MTEVKTTPQRIYSTDHKLWVGMTRRDAYNSDELRTLFKSADVDGDGVLDQKNINYYDGPIFREKLTVKVGDASGLGYGITSEGSGAVTLNSETVTRKDYADYYPGLKLEDLDEKHSVETFRKLDVAPTDGVITKDELKKVYVDKCMDDNGIYLPEKPEKPEKPHNPVLGGIKGGFLGAVGGLCSAFACGVLFCARPKLAAILAGVGFVATMGAGIYVGITGCFSYEKMMQRYKSKKEEFGAEFDEKAKAPGTVYEDMLEPRYIKE